MCFVNLGHAHKNNLTGGRGSKNILEGKKGWTRLE